LQQTTKFVESNYLFLVLFFALNGLVLYIPEHVRQANKEARHMSRFDGILVGVASGLSVIPGLSRVGTGSSIALLRGAGRQNACTWVLLLSIPALVVIVGFDLIALLSSGFGMLTLTSLPVYLLSALFAFAGGWCGIQLLRFLSVRSGYSGFAFYSWGAAMLALILYLIT
jgi:undecaprenyl-diphosphatase